MQLVISHRGNLNGPNSQQENKPTHISELLSSNIHTEIDVWNIKGDFFLGHDEPLYKVEFDFLKSDYLWCHAKNLKALELLLRHNVTCFWHQNDDFTITSNGFIWTFPNKSVCKKSIIVDLTNLWEFQSYDCYGICTDFYAK